MRPLFPLSCVLLAVCLCACGQRGAGTAIANSSKIQVGATAIRPGQEVGFLAVELVNTSRAPLTVESIPVRGPGVGTVVKLVQEEIAPSTSGRNAAPGGIYQTDPPVFWGRDGCHVQALRPVHGFVMRPRHLAWLWEVFRGIKPGRWSVPVHPVAYIQGGVSYREVVNQEDYGVISPNARRIPLDWQERRCLSTARLLR